MEAISVETLVRLLDYSGCSCVKHARGTDVLPPQAHSALPRLMATVCYIQSGFRNHSVCSWDGMTFDDLARQILVYDQENA